MSGCISTFLAFLLITLSVSQTVAQQEAVPNTDPPVIENEVLKERLNKACTDNSLPALWAGRFVTGQPPVLAVAGVRKWKESDPAQIDDAVHLGSCTKAMTAAMIAQLCSEEKLTLDTPLKTVFANVSCVQDSVWGAVTIKELLQHRSGVPANMTYPEFDKAHTESPSDARRMMLERLCTLKRSKSPKFLYSNVGYTLLGHVVETIDGKPWEVRIHDRLFTPLGIRSAGFGPVGTPDGSTSESVLPDRVWGHTEESGLVGLAKSLFSKSSEVSLTPEQHDNSPCMGPAGRVHMNMRDWAKFAIVYGQPNGYETLGISKDVWQAILTPPETTAENESYHGGWIIFDAPAFDGKGYFHNGSNTMWYCYAVVTPGKQQCILVATNCYTTPAQKVCDEIARELVKFPAE